MGYYSRIYGEITIDPPLRWPEYRDSEFQKANTGDNSLMFRESIKETHTADGTVTVRLAEAITARSDDSGSFYDLTDNLVAIAATHRRDHQFRGYLVRVGEETGDIERYWIDGGVVHSERARMSWPDGSEVVIP